MTTIAARPRLLTIAIVVLLVLQVAFVIQAMNEAAAGVSGRPPWLVALNGASQVSLLCGMLVTQKYPRATWALLLLSLSCLVASVVAVRLLRG